MNPDSTQRFSNRVENYVRFRPGYPPAVLDTLRTACALGADSVVADVGSGTGIFSGFLLGTGCTVIGVEPNEAMRQAAEGALSAQARFRSVPGTAEATTLPAGSVDLVTAAQAFHWFDRERARAEFRRILKPHGWMALVWNDRQLDSTPFLRGYEAMLQRFGTDYLSVRHKDLDLAQVQAFVGSEEVQLTVIETVQRFDYAGVEGRLLSSSYAPEAGHRDHAPMLAALRELFDRHQEGGQVDILYDTRVFTAQFPEGR